MDYSRVLRSLVEIERAIGVQDPLTIRNMVMDLEDFLLEDQKRAARSTDLHKHDEAEDVASFVLE